MVICDLTGSLRSYFILYKNIVFIMLIFIIFSKFEHRIMFKKEKAKIPESQNHGVSKYFVRYKIITNCEYDFAC